MISEILYYVFVFPLESVLGSILTNLFMATKSYGLSIIILSLLVNIFLLKIFILTDKKAEFEAERKKRLDSRIKAWKSVYKKAKLFAFTQTLYRQNHYHPIYALSGLGGLALQIPFFYAMYFVIKNAEVLNGVSFLWIADLSLPDSVFGIHLLPILMTIISLINVWIVAKEKSALIQGGLISLIFLVLLYAMPSALVLYWSTNMAFSLIRAIWGKWFGNSLLGMRFRRFAKSPQGTDTKSAILVSIRQKLQKPHRNNFDCVKGESNNNLSLRESATFDKVADSWQSAGFVSEAKQPSKNSPSLAESFAFDSPSIADGDKGGGYDYRQISICAIVCIAFLICVFTPYQLYSTDITQFDSAEMVATLSTLFGTFIISAFAIIYILSFIPKRFSKVVAFALSVVLFSGIVYSFILVGDYGAMDHFVLQKPPEKDFMPIVEWFCVLLAGSMLVFFVFKKLLRATQIIFITLFVVSGVNVFQIIDKQLDFSTIHLPYENELFSYSKNDKNIVVVVLDMFSGSHTPYILEQFPEFKTQLDGFTLFPNAISTTNSTVHSMATLIGGEHYATYNMNKRKLNLIDEIDKAFIDTTNAFAQDNFSVAMMAFVGTNVANLKPKLHNEIFALDSYSEAFLNYYVNGENLSIEINNAKNAKYTEKIRLISFGVFKFAPKVLHYEIYRNGAWLSHADTEDVLFASDSIKNSASFYASTHILNTNATKPTFKFLHSMMTHLPYGMYFNGKECKFFDNKSAWDDYPHNVKMYYPYKWREKNFYQHFDTEACALKYLSDYIQSLKKLGIYDNTQIFVVSDHSGNDNINIPILDKDDSRPDTLLLFKDFNAKGSLKIDNRLMANYDIASIFCENLPNGCPNVPPNILKNYPQNRELIHTIPSAWQLEGHKKNEWLITKAYKVKDNIYDEKNWINISDESYGIVNVK